MALVARGAKRPTSQFRGLLSAFNPLALSWSGRNEIKTLIRAEWLGGMQPLRGDALLAAFYVNELLVRLLARGDAHERLFGSYVALLQALGEHVRHDAAARLRVGPARRDRL
jgi:DNA repair protein RecO (recombination protein O)